MPWRDMYLQMGRGEVLEGTEETEGTELILSSFV
jgi:hypothetical protein